MNVAVFGSNGRVGSLVVKNLILQKHHVIAIINQHDENIPNHPLVTKIKVDYNNHHQLIQIINQSDAIISTVSSWKTKNKNSLVSVMNYLVPILSQQNNKHLISLTGSDARLSNDDFDLINFFFHPFLNLIAKKVLEDSENHLKILQTSQINWTVLRSPTMKDSQNTNYQLSFKRPPIWHLVSRQAVAKALVDLLNNRQYFRQAPFIF